MPHNQKIMYIYSTRTYERAIRKLLSEEARKEMETSVAAAPDAAPVIRGTGGLRKLRWTGSGRGKRGGIRVIYFWHCDPETIYMLTAYAKGKQDDITAMDKKTFSRLISTIKQARRKR